MSDKSKQLETVEKNHLGHFTYLPKKLGFKVYNTHGVAVINCGLHTSTFNIAYGYPATLTTTLHRIKQAFSGQPFAWWIPPSQRHADKSKELINNGFVMETVEHAMICDLTHIDCHKQQTNLSICQATTNDLLDDFINVLEHGDPYAMPFYAGLNNKLLNLQEKFFVGYNCDEPVTVGILFVSGNSAGIFCLITKENCRGSGYGTDMIIYLMKMAKNYGCQLITLSASSNSGLHLYSRLKFHKVGEFDCFEFMHDET